ncbi:DUF4238 domain-containing protein [Nocardia sp. NPDC088792]|uniref:DUF4238 domain-containing protein n=1 Tax=Nocardia sp. NPDC088792 TaxID=3364332 RepID=UPI00381778D9
MTDSVWGRTPTTQGGKDVVQLVREYMKRIEEKAKQRDCPSRRHHYVPQSYLRAWSDDGDRRVRVLLTRRGIDRLCGVKDVCVSENLYRAIAPDGEAHNQYEAMLGIIDDESARILRILQRHRPGDDLDFDDFMSLAVVMAFQHSRTPQTIRLIADVTKWMSHRMGEDPKEVGGSLLLDTVFAHLYTLADEFSIRQLELWDDPRGRFITSDQPIQPSMDRPGEFPPIHEGHYVWWPISPNRLAVLSTDNGNAKVIVRNATSNEVRAVRGAYVRGAEEAIIAVPTDRDLPHGRLLRRPQIVVNCKPKRSEDGCEFSFTYGYASRPLDQACLPLCPLAQAAMEGGSNKQR